LLILRGFQEGGRKGEGKRRGDLKNVARALRFASVAGEKVATRDRLERTLLKIIL
jgi:hypothetical protein